jgi:hypothetical protein
MSPPGFETLCLTFTAPIVHCKEEAMWESWFNECSTETLQSSETQYSIRVREPMFLSVFPARSTSSSAFPREKNPGQKMRNEKKTPHLPMRNMKFSNIVMQVIFSKGERKTGSDW